MPPRPVFLAYLSALRPYRAQTKLTAILPPVDGHGTLASDTWTQCVPDVYLKSGLTVSLETRMFELLAWLLSMVVCAGLVVPLLYALGTLQGMREKRIYPLLRLRERDGQVSSLTVTRHDALRVSGS